MSPPRRMTIAWTAGDGQELSLTLDAVVKRTVTLENDVTEHPVERGASLTDHVRPQAIRLSFEGVVSNTPHYLPSDHRGAAQETQHTIRVTMRGFKTRTVVEGTNPRLGNIITPPLNVGADIPIGPKEQVVVGASAPNREASTRALTFTQEFDRVQEVYDELKALWFAGTLLRVTTPLDVYEDMVIKVCEPAQETSQGQGFFFTLQLMQVRLGETDEVEIPAEVATGRKSVGTQTPEPVSDEGDTTERNSLALWGVQGIAGLLQ